MITYKYKTESGNYFEVKQSINDDPLTECPKTGESCKRVFNAHDADVLFMGKGWDKSRRQEEENEKARRTDPLYTTDPTYKKKLDKQLEDNQQFAEAYQKKKHELKKKL